MDVMTKFYLGKPSKVKKTAIIVTLSLSGGRGVSHNPYYKTNNHRDMQLCLEGGGVL